MVKVPLIIHSLLYQSLQLSHWWFGFSGPVGCERQV